MPNVVPMRSRPTSQTPISSQLSAMLSLLPLAMRERLLTQIATFVRIARSHPEAASALLDDGDELLAYFRAQIHMTGPIAPKRARRVG